MCKAISPTVTTAASTSSASGRPVSCSIRTASSTRSSESSPSSDSRSPLLYQFFIRSSITRWYRTVRQAELRANTIASFDIDAEIKQLTELDLRLTKELSVNNLYMPDVYNLRSNIDFVIRKLERRKAQMEAAQMEKVASSDGGAGADGVGEGVSPLTFEIEA